MLRLPLYPDGQPAPVDGAGLPLSPTCERCSFADAPGTGRLAADIGKGLQPDSLLVVGDSPVKRAVRPFASASGVMVRDFVSKHWQGGVVYDYAIRCPPKNIKKPSDAAKPIRECRPHLAHVISQVKPSRVLAVGPWAVQSLLGRSLDMNSVRRGYGWILDDVPVFIVKSPLRVIESRFTKKEWEQDVEWALRVPTPTPDHRHGFAYVVQNDYDAVLAERALDAFPELLFDVETAGIPHGGDFTVLCAGLAPVDELEADSYVWSREALEDPASRAVLQRILDSKIISGSNIKYDAIAAAENLGVRIKRYGTDTQLARKLSEPNCHGRLDYAVELVGMGGSKEEAKDHLQQAIRDARLKKQKAGAASHSHWCVQAIRSGTPGGSPMSYAYGLIPDDVLWRYNGRDVASSAAVVRKVRSRMAKKQPHEVQMHDEILVPALDSFRRIESAGLQADRQAFETFASHLKIGLDELAEKFKPFQPFNPNSSQQVARILYDRLGLPKPQHKTGSGALPTDADTLEMMRGLHWFPGALMEHRRLAKLDSTYASGMIEHILSDGRIHPTFRLDGTECMPAGELVLTDRGYLPVEQVRVGDYVISHTGKQRKVLDAFQNGIKRIVRVKLNTGLTLRTTENHEYRLAAVRPLGEEWRRADQLTAGVRVVTHAPMERWRPSQGWPYYVSSWGRIKRYGTDECIQPVKVGEWGHLQVTLRDHGKRTTIYVHKLVMAVHGQPRPSPKHEIRHLNGIAWDNTISNLSWGTSTENKADARRHGTMSHRGDHASRKLTQAQVNWVRVTPRARVSDAAAARKLDVSRELVSMIRRGERWQPEGHITGKQAVLGYATVEEIIHEPFLVMTYGLTVEEDHSHVTGGIVTHNTMRISSENPNGQNIPRAGTPEGKYARDGFTASHGRILIELDQSQVELRVAAGMSGDPDMKKIFSDNLDYHLRTAQLIAKGMWHIAEEAITEEHRAQVKPVNFGLLYGKTDAGLAAELHCSLAEAAQLRAQILGRFKLLDKLIKRLIADARRNGYTTVPWLNGAEHHRPLPDIASQDKLRRSNAENASVNTPIQGRAALYTLAAIPQIHAWIDAMGLEEYVDIVNTVHDSILFDCEPVVADLVIAEASNIMTSFDCWGVPLVADAKAGPAWGTLHKIKRGEKLFDAQARWAAEGLMAA